MGWKMKILCHECNYQQEFLLGFGFNYMLSVFFGGKSRLSLTDFVKKEEQKTIIQLMDTPGVQVEGSEERLYRCSNCNELSNQYYYRIMFYGGEHEPNYTCSRCGHLLEILRVSEEKKFQY